MKRSASAAIFGLAIDAKHCAHYGLKFAAFFAKNRKTSATCVAVERLIHASGAYRRVEAPWR
jgi:hypothetical protein